VYDAKRHRERVDGKGTTAIEDVKEPERRLYRVCLDDHCEELMGRNGVEAIRRFAEDCHIEFRLRPYIHAERADKVKFPLSTTTRARRKGVIS
jgi:hypothetical protein